MSNPPSDPVWDTQWAPAPPPVPGAQPPTSPPTYVAAPPVAAPVPYGAPSPYAAPPQYGAPAPFGAPLSAPPPDPRSAYVPYGQAPMDGERAGNITIIRGSRRSVAGSIAGVLLGLQAGPLVLVAIEIHRLRNIFETELGGLYRSSGSTGMFGDSQLVEAVFWAVALALVISGSILGLGKTAGRVLAILCEVAILGVITIGWSSDTGYTGTTAVLLAAIPIAVVLLVTRPGVVTD